MVVSFFPRKLGTLSLFFPDPQLLIRGPITGVPQVLAGEVGSVIRFPPVFRNPEFYSETAQLLFGWSWSIRNRTGPTSGKFH